MKRASLLLITILILATAISAQCILPLSRAPKLAGISLGMSSEQVIAHFGKPFSHDEKSLGYVSAVPELAESDVKIVDDIKLRTLKVHRPANFDGLSQVSIGLTENKVTEILVSYEGVEWNSPKEFANELSAKLRIPGLWTFKGDKATLDCRSWSMNADAVSNQIFLLDMEVVYKKVIADRAKAAEKKKAFKP